MWDDLGLGHFEQTGVAVFRLTGTTFFIFLFFNFAETGLIEVIIVIKAGSPRRS